MTLLGHHDFRLLWTAQTLGQFGTHFSRVGLPLVAILALDATAFEAGLLATFQTVAFLLVGLPAGAWVDRRRKRPIMIAANLGRGLLLGWVPVGAYLGVLTLTQLYIVALGVSVGTLLFETAYVSYLPLMLERGQLVEGNAKLESTRSVAQVGGPTLGGYLVQWFGPPLAVLTVAVGYLASALAVSRIRMREDLPVRGARSHLVGEIRQGLSYVFRHRVLRALAVSGALFNLGVYVTGTVVVVLLAQQLRISPGTVGLWFAIGGLGGLVGAFVVQRISVRLGPGPTVWVGMAVAGVAGLVVPLADADWRLWLAGAGNALVSTGLVINNVNSMAIRQQLCPQELQGRMNATIRFLVFGAMPIGSFLGGFLGEQIGLRETLWVGAVLSLVAVLPVYFSPLRTMRGQPDADDQKAAPEKDG
ncbi:MFS transporter [Micromonospora gifhornensis]|uniref:MFS transporter n=1 Tax=Micromonospora gifhornensis TaxID=84594 RepID=A0ABQ4I8W0_9ACTN|nr:MFS transporter [Micromonospora gifhornensis]GIJ14241.1 MFS transporter [Micromonospora gifhornensis]